MFWRLEYVFAACVILKHFQADKLVQVIVGSVAAGDSPELVSTSLKDLELAVWLLQEASQHPVPRKGLVRKNDFG